MSYELEEPTYIYLEQGDKKLFVTHRKMVARCKARDLQHKHGVIQHTKYDRIGMANTLGIDWVN